MTNIFVGNLPYGVTEAELTDCFGQYGVVEKASLIRDRDTGQSRGSAFVAMRYTRPVELSYSIGTSLPQSFCKVIDAIGGDKSQDSPMRESRK